MSENSEKRNKLTLNLAHVVQDHAYNSTINRNGNVTAKATFRMATPATTPQFNGFINPAYLSDADG